MSGSSAEANFNHLLCHFSEHCLDTRSILLSQAVMQTKHDETNGFGCPVELGAFSWGEWRFIEFARITESATSIS